MVSVKRQLKPTSFKKQVLNKSKGIFDDYAVRKNIATREGTVEKVPVNDSDIVNKKYVDDNSLWEVSGTGTQLKTADEINIQDNFLYFDAAKTVGLIGTGGNLGVGLAPGKVLNMNTNKITGVTDPTAAQDAVTKNYADNLVVADHGTASTDQVVNVCYGTGEPPAANTTTEGALFIKYTA